ncbi:hypothetical protein AY601_0942 [Pedobacter cryoconitis]|uniref:Uncharacterized protein n=1 Tax=Pedobacter cryoconitis TaxID=188932 RepID=A0A127V9N3_9SPHI|nr:hypothetical protein [Pedobacter cryoconitis]AMP97881.1 hypothetical protein AY601_0942 [Pedobacter cryoconitis]
MGEFELNTEAAILSNYISIIITGKLCNPEWVSYGLNLRNSHSKTSIWTRIDIYTLNEFGHRILTESKEFTVLPASEIFLACPIPGPTGQKFEYVIGASSWI